MALQEVTPSSSAPASSPSPASPAFPTPSRLDPPSPYLPSPLGASSAGPAPDNPISPRFCSPRAISPPPLPPPVPPSLWARVERTINSLCHNRWLGLICGLWLLACAGSSATFAIYSPALKAVGGYNQREVDGLAVAKDMGESVGLLPGLLCDALPVWALVLVGSLHYLVGFSGLFAVATQRILPLPFWQMCGLMLMGSQGTAWFNTAVLVTCVRNFPRSRGSVVGLLKGVVGLSGAIFTQVYAALIAPDQAAYLGFIAIVPPLVSLPAMTFLRPSKRLRAGHCTAHETERDVRRREEHEAQTLHTFLVIALGLAAYLLLAMLLHDSNSSQQVRRRAGWRWARGNGKRGEMGKWGSGEMGECCNGESERGRREEWRRGRGAEEVGEISMDRGGWLPLSSTSDARYRHQHTSNSPFPLFLRLPVRLAYPFSLPSPQPVPLFLPPNSPPTLSRNPSSPLVQFNRGILAGMVSFLLLPLATFLPPLVPTSSALPSTALTPTASVTPPKSRRPSAEDGGAGEGGLERSRTWDGGEAGAAAGAAGAGGAGGAGGGEAREERAVMLGSFLEDESLLGGDRRGREGEGTGGGFRGGVLERSESYDSLLSDISRVSSLADLQSYFARGGGGGGGALGMPSPIGMGMGMGGGGAMGGASGAYWATEGSSSSSMGAGGGSSGVFLAVQGVGGSSSPMGSQQAGSCSSTGGYYYPPSGSIPSASASSSSALSLAPPRARPVFSQSTFSPPAPAFTIGTSPPPPSLTLAAPSATSAAAPAASAGAAATVPPAGAATGASLTSGTATTTAASSLRSPVGLAAALAPASQRFSSLRPPAQGSTSDSARKEAPASPSMGAGGAGDVLKEPLLMRQQQEEEGEGARRGPGPVAGAAAAATAAAAPSALPSPPPSTTASSHFSFLSRCLPISCWPLRPSTSLPTQQQLQQHHHHHHTEEERRRKQAELLLAVGEGAVRVGGGRRRSGPRRGQDFTLQQAAVKADFWLLFVSFLCGTGSGLTAINNLAQMGAAQGYSSVRVFLSLLSVSNFVGRLLAGYASEHVVKDHMLPRPVLLLLAQSLMAVGHIFFALAFPSSLHLGSVIVGLCYGVHWSIMPATASEIFGLKHFGMLYNTLTAACPMGSFVFSGMIAGYFSASSSSSVVTQSMSTVGSGGLHGAEWPVSDKVEECYGAHCFRLTFFIMAAVCLLGVCLNLILILRTRVVYASLYAQPDAKAQKEEAEVRAAAREVVSAAAAAARRARYVPTGHTLGRGAFGTVRVCRDSATGGEVAVKTISKRVLALDNPDFADDFRQEVAIMRLVSRSEVSGVVRLLDVRESRDHVHLVMERCNAGSLSALIKSRQRLPEHEAADVIRQLLTTVAGLHKIGVIHRDLKPENVLLCCSNTSCMTTADCQTCSRTGIDAISGVSSNSGDTAREDCAERGRRRSEDSSCSNSESGSTSASASGSPRVPSCPSGGSCDDSACSNGGCSWPSSRGGARSLCHWSVKLADFGLAVCLPAPSAQIRGVAGTAFYMAPEVARGRLYGREADMWSLGVVLHVLLSGRLPFYGRTEDETRKKACAGHVVFSDKYWAGVSGAARQAVLQMLTVEPRWRATAEQVLHCDWLRETGQC
ncbi:unnamed protein product [Closterium sp. NIES-65]|nr:unnamed protein product [Closterium sp. NIES-65]